MTSFISLFIIVSFHWFKKLFDNNNYWIVIYISIISNLEFRFTGAAKKTNYDVFAKDLCKHELEKGDWASRSNGELLAVAFNDNSLVCFLTNATTDKPTQSMSLFSDLIWTIHNQLSLNYYPLLIYSIFFLSPYDLI
jgi:hypothetical protein